MKEKGKNQIKEREREQKGEGKVQKFIHKDLYNFAFFIYLCRALHVFLFLLDVLFCFVSNIQDPFKPLLISGYF